MVLERIDEVFRQTDAIYGFADISVCGLSFTKALVFALPYRQAMSLESYEEQVFENNVAAAREEAEELLLKLEAVLKESGIAYKIPLPGQKDEIALEAELSFKFAALQAGLGWIGKNDALITEAFGPRLRLGAILLEGDIPCGSPVTKSRCPQSCRLCQDACPCKAVKGVLWEPQKPRETRLDYRQCNRHRSEDIERLGRKNACGRCMTACPWGRLHINPAG